MKKIFIFIMLILFVGAYCNTPLQAKQASEDFFPLKVGSWWRYKIADTKTELTIAVTASEKINKTDCYKVESSLREKGAPTLVILVEYIHKAKNGVFEVKALEPAQKNKESLAGINYFPHKKIIPTPLNIGDSWNYAGSELGINASIQKRTAVKKEKIDVPAGKFEAVQIDSVITNDGRKMYKSAWYVKGIGPVKLVSKSAGKTTNVVLVEYKVN